MAVQSYWILAGTGRPCRARRSRASQTCSMGDMSGEYAGQNWDMLMNIFSFQELCPDPCDMGHCIVMLKHEVMNGKKWDSVSRHVSLCIQIAINKMQLCSLSVAYACPYHKPTTIWGTLFTTFISANRSPTWRHNSCHLPGTVETGITREQRHTMTS
jgi:hypothetical protein